MKKQIAVTVSPYDLKKFLLKEGFMAENDLISKIHLIAENGGILVEILNPQTWSERQKEFMNMPLKDMDMSVKLIKAIGVFFSFEATGSTKERKIFEALRGSDLFEIRKEKDWKKIENFGVKSIYEFNEILKKYDLPPLEKEGPRKRLHV